MKKLGDIFGKSVFEFLEPRSAGDKKFLVDHPVTKTTGPAGSPEADDKLFNAANIRPASKPGKGPAAPDNFDTVKSATHGKASTTTEEVSAEIVARLLEGEYEASIAQIKLIKAQLAKHVGDPSILKAQLAELRKKRNLLGARRSDLKDDVQVDLDAVLDEAVLAESAYQACDHAHSYTRFMDQFSEHGHRAEMHAHHAADKNMEPRLKKFHTTAGAAHGELAKAMKAMADHHLVQLGDAHKKVKK